jgi:CDP-diacylglycerol pyrophosphatase
MRRVSFLILVAGLAFGVSASPTNAPHSMALWRVVHALCMTDMKISGHPAPCLEVNPDGYVVLRDPGARTEVLLVPTVQLIGIESPQLLAPESPNYWQAAWDARRYLAMRVGGTVPREDIGLAVNSVFGRTQDQLHIHVDCVLPEVKAALAAHENEIGERFAPLGFTLAGKHYRARRLDGEDLGGQNPFKLLAGSGLDAGGDMSRQTLAVVAVRWPDGRPGFVLLATTGGTLENPSGASEALLDHSCALLA